MPKVKAWNKKLSIETYEGGQEATIQVVDNESRELLGEQVSVPIQIMYRLYHLGRAYDFQTMKLLRPDGTLIFDWTNMQQLQAELRRLSDVVIDPVIEHYVRALLTALDLTKTKMNSRLIYVASDAS